jgi:hypothetical protein
MSRYQTCKLVQPLSFDVLIISMIQGLYLIERPNSPLSAGLSVSQGGSSFPRSLSPICMGPVLSWLSVSLGLESGPKICEGRRETKIWIDRDRGK